MGSDGAELTIDNQAVIINPVLNWGNDERFQSSDYEILGLPQNGTFAQKVVVPTKQIVAKSEYLTFEEAAALPLAGLTAWRALLTKCQKIFLKSYPSVGRQRYQSFPLSIFFLPHKLITEG